ncbi:hypothetical protein SGRA_0092 [Saprospira grandis str. Lewin]|uniref:Uncharacterized protein n=1 Tax=Saprospira grandis (strain Lewin) TaxID=984262 RepID=H6L4F8_SAPGL|nr:hypothetical protein SGRA_0092 [Saprospira grandis str. Lewin]
MVQKSCIGLLFFQEMLANSCQGPIVGKKLLLDNYLLILFV